MTRYFDSSVLVALYVPEPSSGRAAALVSGSIPYTQFHELEMANTIERLCGYGKIDATERDAVRQQVLQDLAQGRLARCDVDWDATFHRAVDLAAAHSRLCLARSLDVLHVAAAEMLGFQEFVTGDERQLCLAKAAGLKTRRLKS